MMGALSARRRPAGAAIAAAAVGAALVIVSSASAATSATTGSAPRSTAPRSTAPPSTALRTAALRSAARPGEERPGGAQPGGAAGGAQRPGRTDGRSIATLFATVRVFTSASSRGGVRGKLAGPGVRVSVTCWTTGAFHADVPIWYEVSAPVAGYVSAFNLAAHYAPAAGVPHCVAPVFKDTFYALEQNLRIRTAPSTAATITGHLVSIGSRVKVTCYVTGSAVFDDPVWYHAVSPASGFVAGRMLNTGGDPAPGVPRC